MAASACGLERKHYTTVSAHSATFHTKKINTIRQKKNNSKDKSNDRNLHIYTHFTHTSMLPQNSHAVF